MTASAIKNCMISTLSRPDSYFQQLAELVLNLPLEPIEEIVESLLKAYFDGRTIFVFGNGGSAALASHMACDLGKGSSLHGVKPVRISALTDNLPLITAWANDLSYDSIFAEQLKPFLVSGDLCFAISGSGNSPNVIKALQVSKEVGGFNVGITGYDGGNMKELCDVCLIVPSTSMQHIEDIHVAVSHSVFLAFRSRITQI